MASVRRVPSSSDSFLFCDEIMSDSDKENQPPRKKVCVVRPSNLQSAQTLDEFIAEEDEFIEEQAALAAAIEQDDQDDRDLKTISDFWTKRISSEDWNRIPQSLIMDNFDTGRAILVFFKHHNSYRRYCMRCFLKSPVRNAHFTVKSVEDAHNIDEISKEMLFCYTCKLDLYEEKTLLN